jgi:hypothetical protein
MITYGIFPGDSLTFFTAWNEIHYNAYWDQTLAHTCSVPNTVTSLGVGIA